MAGAVARTSASREKGISGRTAEPEVCQVPTFGKMGGLQPSRWIGLPAGGGAVVGPWEMGGEMKR